MPVDADYLWNQGRACLRWAQECFDLSTAARLRVLGEDFLNKAAELESEFQNTQKRQKSSVIAARRPSG